MFLIVSRGLTLVQDLQSQSIAAADAVAADLPKSQQVVGPHWWEAKMEQHGSIMNSGSVVIERIETEHGDKHIYEQTHTEREREREIYIYIDNQYTD